MTIDWWTLALQTVNVLILVWILGRFFFRPVAAIVARRQEEATRLLSDAEAQRRQAEAERREAAKARAGLEAERGSLVEQAHKAAEAEKSQLLAQSAREIAHLRDEAAAAAERDRAAAEHVLVAQAGELAIDIARRLLARLPPGAALAAFVDGLCQEARTLPEEAREGFKPAPGSDEAVEVRTATALSEEEQRLVRARLGEALGFGPPLVFRQDPALLAGLEVHGRTTVLRNDWRADLERIRRELSRDRRAQAA